MTTKNMLMIAFMYFCIGFTAVGKFFVKCSKQIGGFPTFLNFLPLIF